LGINGQKEEVKIMLKEFKEFAMKGSVVDLAVGVVIGGAFGKIVTSLVDDIIMPLVGLLLGGVDYSKWTLSLGDATINYGLFIGSVLDFLIISFSIFFIIRQLNKFKKKEVVEETKPTTKTCNYCKTEIPIDAAKCPHCTSSLE
jgi:large conductance mechanosensitive channel